MQEVDHQGEALEATRGRRAAAFSVHVFTALGAGIAVLCIFFPGLVLAAAGRYWWHALARAPRARAALAGVNAGAVGILGAALYNPVLLGALHLPAG